MCRVATGTCDAAETCDGIADACPVDVLAPAGTVCRAANGVCDVTETCSGSTRDCPSDTRLPDGSTCPALGCATSGICQAGICAVSTQNDADGDGVCDTVDNCLTSSNPGQANSDGDGLGDACDNCAADFNPCQEDANGNGIGDVCDVASVGEPPASDGVQLGAPWPNPVTGALGYSISLPRAGHVRVEVYGVGGRLVRTLLDRELPGGHHDFTWDARGERAARLASGVYHLRLTAAGVQRSRKFTLIR